MAGVGWILQASVVRPLIGRPNIVLVVVITTLAAGSLIENGALEIWGPRSKQIPPLLAGNATIGGDRRLAAPDRHHRHHAADPGGTVAVPQPHAAGPGAARGRAERGRQPAGRPERHRALRPGLRDRRGTGRPGRHLPGRLPLHVAGDGRRPAAQSADRGRVRRHLQHLRADLRGLSDRLLRSGLQLLFRPLLDACAAVRRADPDPDGAARRHVRRHAPGGWHDRGRTNDSYPRRRAPGRLSWQREAVGLRRSASRCWRSCRWSSPTATAATS